MQRDYHPDQLGREARPEEYVNEIASVFELFDKSYFDILRLSKK